ncbi:MAG: nicotinamide riboside transporter PnuC [Planctomycetes bacterium]|nr:nicotinamide riboside transporter PnuC [Planctomycetota bacterium]NBY02218.1 nicotinamide riboside transporter PnuC [Planctomycetota bacterium]
MDLYSAWNQLVATILETFSPWELAGFLTGIVCVWQVVCRNIWNFLWGILSCACFLVLFLQQRLFGEAILQVIFIALNIHGWIGWFYQGKNQDSLKVANVSKKEGFILAVMVFPFTSVLWALLTWLNGSAPIVDAWVTSLSLIAQWLLNRKFIQSWPVWILVDVLTIGLGVYRGMFLLAVLYVIYLSMCLVGWYSWRKNLPAVGGKTHG